MLWGEDDLPERVDLRVPPRESSGLPTSDYGHYGVRLSARYEPLSLEPALRMRAIRPSIIRTMGSEIEVTYITASTPEEVVQARAGVRGATGAASILTRCVTLRGWKCVACRRLGDLGGEEELAIHLRVYHAGECAVECFGRTAVSDRRWVEVMLTASLAISSSWACWSCWAVRSQSLQSRTRPEWSLSPQVTGGGRA